jgi:hypothetical protein
MAGVIRPPDYEFVTDGGVVLYRWASARMALFRSEFRWLYAGRFEAGRIMRSPKIT